METVTIKWEKPLRASEFDVDDRRKFLTNNGGVYLWITPTTPPRVCYVGETNNFWDRHVGWEGHFVHQTGGLFTTFDLTNSKNEDFLKFYKDHWKEGQLQGPLGQGQKVFNLDPNRITVNRHFLNREHLEICLEQLKNLSFAFATVSPGGEHRQSRRKIEGVLSRGLCQIYEEIAKHAGWQGKPISLGQSDKNMGAFKLIHQGEVSRLPAEVLEVTHWPLSSPPVHFHSGSIAE